MKSGLAGTASSTSLSTCGTSISSIGPRRASATLSREGVAELHRLTLVAQRASTIRTVAVGDRVGENDGRIVIESLRRVVEPGCERRADLVVGAALSNPLDHRRRLEQHVGAVGSGDVARLEVRCGREHDVGESAVSVSTWSCTTVNRSSRARPACTAC